MQQYEGGTERGLIYGYVLDGRGGGRQIARSELQLIDLKPEESLWVHWDRGVPEAQSWLREVSGLNEFTCDLLLEEATRPRVVDLGAERLLVFLRGVNLNPGAAPEDMVSLRVFAESQRVISLRLRPLKAVADVRADLANGRGPKNASELVLSLAHYLTDRIDTLIGGLADELDNMEEAIEEDERSVPDQAELRTLRRRSAGLRRYLAPQRDIYAQLMRIKLSWTLSDDADYWNELYNRLTRNTEELELVRERISLIQEAEHRRITERMNKTMYILGIITGFFLPMSFITGLLGINVGGIPGSSAPHGFIIACVLLVGVAGFQWWVFRRLRWL
ncbi:zinc transporter ZntB [Pseudomonas citronellolis]|uniref:zinc transporter ZntB n=1 Tax=Pseudomonas citronellolis TaxID=53408 RepID=UPI0023E42B00|nr:zinc transporter ZntB [Pseudomonas citronellolis]MDF3932740.1 zinc transporter ZntB [Pseudomonas citronellolis]